MQYWLLKTEPETFSFEDLMNKKSEMWDGVRNYQARNFMKQMKMNDLCLIYHSGKEKGVAGLAKVVKEFYPDPTSNTDQWVCVDLAPLKKLHFTPLSEIKKNSQLQNLPLIKQGRLSVMPVSAEEFQILSQK